MTIWHKLLERLQIRDPFDDRVPAAAPSDPVGFSISLLALCAKMAKADGQITRDEVRCVRSIIQISPEDERNAGRVFDLCGQDPSGFEAYARKIRKAIGDGPDAASLREDVLDALHHVAMADGEFHPGEAEMLTGIAHELQVPQSRLAQITARHVPDAWDPFAVLGVAPGAGQDELKTAWRALVKNEHPDAVQARGLPKEMIRIAEERMARINLAYDELRGSPELSLA